MTGEVAASLPVVAAEIELVVVEAGGHGFEHGVDPDIGLDFT